MDCKFPAMAAASIESGSSWTTLMTSRWPVDEFKALPLNVLTSCFIRSAFSGETAIVNVGCGPCTALLMLTPSPLTAFEIELNTPEVNGQHNAQAAMTMISSVIQPVG